MTMHTTSRTCAIAFIAFIASTALLSGKAAADFVIADDLIVQGSACVGLDCVNNEPFGFDTIKLKENNLRIKFEDTSVAPFPTNDWQLTASSGEKIPVRTALDNGRSGAASESVLKGVSTSGQIHLKDGRIVKFDPAAREPAKVKRPTGK